MIKIFKVKSFAHTPFSNEEDLVYLREHGIEITTDITKADILISQNFKHLKKYFLRYLKEKQYLVWTHEPRFDTSFTSFHKILFGFHKCYFMNIYTQDVFTTIPAFNLSGINKNLSLLTENSCIGNNKVVAVMSYYQGVNAKSLFRNRENIDLIGLRSKLALEGSKRGILDVYGNGWPENVSIEDSRAGNWTGRKEEILREYSFNLCFENTIAYNYVTEKIWDSIGSYCLPIYYGKNTNIYTIFPRNSFIDYSDFEDSTSLFNFIENISDDDFVTRLNKCIDVYNSFSKLGKLDEWNIKVKILKNIIDKCNVIMSK